MPIELNIPMTITGTVDSVRNSICLPNATDRSLR